jgi:S-adenosylmethionine decarboxylase
MHRTLGHHIICEAYGCDPKIIEDCELVEAAMVEAARQAGAEIREVAFHRYSPQGISGVVVISQSHLSIHTWPEHNYAAIDVFTCGDAVDPWAACQFLLTQLGADYSATMEVVRGFAKSDLSQSANRSKVHVKPLDSEVE